MGSLANIIKLLRNKEKHILTGLFAYGFVVSLSSQIIVIDAGHGYNTDCSNGDGRTYTEINTAHEVSIRLENIISANAPSYTVFKTRPSNACGSWVSISQRASMANNWNADVFLSIHCNAGGGTGTETFWCDQAASSNGIDQSYAGLVQNKMVQHGNWYYRALTEDYPYLLFHLGVLRNLTMSGCLSEIGFVDNIDSVKLLNTAWRDSFALAYYEALIGFLDPSNVPLLSCDQAVAVYAGIVYHGNASLDSSLVTSYGCNNWTETGPERVHVFVLDTTQDFTVSLSNFQGDLDVYILSSCNELDCVGDVYSSSATYLNAPAGTYYIVVDADDGSGSAYDLLINTQTMSIHEIQMDQSLESMIRVYPNPAQNQLNIDCSKFPLQKAQFQVFDMQGRMVFPQGFWNETVYFMDVSILSTGFYTLCIQTDDAKQTFIKFVKTQ